MTPGEEIALRIDQTLTQDATGTMVMLELEAMGLDRVRTEVSVQYVDHNLLQADRRNADDHLFLRSACRRFGLWYSKPGNGVCHPVAHAALRHAGQDAARARTRTPWRRARSACWRSAPAGSRSRMAMAGEPLYLRCREIWGVRLVGELPAG